MVDWQGLEIGGVFSCRRILEAGAEYRLLAEGRMFRAADLGALGAKACEQSCKQYFQTQTSWAVDVRGAPSQGSSGLALWWLFLLQ